jgi:hypothetical protein
LGYSSSSKQSCGSSQPIADDTANEWYITGVQLEAGTTASDFEFLPVDVNLARCQRYFELHFLKEFVGVGQAFGTSGVRAGFNYLVQKRADPTITLPSVGNTSGLINFLNSTLAYPATTGTITVSNVTVSRFVLNGDSFTSSFTAGDACMFYSTGTSQIKIDSEL